MALPEGTVGVCCSPCRCLRTAVAHGQASNQNLGQFQGQGDIGTILLPGSGHYDISMDSYTISGSGANLWFGIDDFHYIWRKMSGDVALSAEHRLCRRKRQCHRKAVLMIRQSLDAHSIYADVARHGRRPHLIAVPRQQSARTPTR